MEAMLLAEGASLALGWRGARGARPLYLARPRRGNIDLGDRDDTPRTRDEHGAGAGAGTWGGPAPRWLVPGAVTAAVVAAATARAAVVLI
jgi:hypothetical protein